jgi:hypothetical protein
VAPGNSRDRFYTKMILAMLLSSQQMIAIRAGSIREIGIEMAAPVHYKA